MRVSEGDRGWYGPSGVSVETSSTKEEGLTRRKKQDDSRVGVPNLFYSSRTLLWEPLFPCLLWEARGQDKCKDFTLVEEVTGRQG